MSDYLDKVSFEFAQDEVDLVSLLTKRLCSDAVEYVTKQQDAKELLDLMPDDFKPDYRWRESEWIREKEDRISFRDSKVRRDQLKSDIKKLRRELLTLAAVLDDVPEVCR